MDKSSVLAQLFVVAADEVGIAIWDWITVDWNEGIVRFASGQFVGNAGADFQERCHHLHPNYGPIGLFTVALVFLAGQAGALAGDGDAVAQFGNIDHFLDIAQPIRPGTEIVAGNGTRKGRALFIKEAVPIAVEAATEVAAFVAPGQTSAIAAAASAVASALSELRVAAVLIVAVGGPPPPPPPPRVGGGGGCGPPLC